MIKKKLAEMWEQFKTRLDNATTPKKVQKFYTATVIIAAVLIVITTFCSIYVNDYYRADSEAIIEAIEASENIGCYSYTEGVKVYKSEDSGKTGIIFYPGGKVEYTSYEPLMYALAERGIVAVLCEMPFNLAVLDMNAADDIIETMPEIDSWYICGHSLGGSMAASYIAKQSDKIDGLVLLASYSTADVSNVKVLSIYGSNDGVMNRKKYKKYKNNLPESLTEIIIEGGNHAGFGMYGAQKGDGEAEISNIKQITYTADCIAEFIK